MDFFSSLKVTLNHRTKLRELLLFIKLFVATITEIWKNNLLKGGIESDNTFTKVSGNVLLIYFTVWKFMAPAKQNHAKE